MHAMNLLATLENLCANGFDGYLKLLSPSTFSVETMFWTLSVTSNTLNHFCCSDVRNSEAVEEGEEIHDNEERLSGKFHFVSTTLPGKAQKTVRYRPRHSVV